MYSNDDLSELRKKMIRDTERYLTIRLRGHSASCWPVACRPFVRGIAPKRPKQSPTWVQSVIDRLFGRNEG